MTIESVIALDKAHYMNTYGERIPLAFTHGMGSTLYDQDGKAYIDFLAGIAVNVLGYAHEEFTHALIEQMGKILHCSNYFYIPQQAQLAEALCRHSCADRVFFASTGAEANEGAIKLARKYFKAKGEQRFEVISAHNSFHGRTLAALAMTGQEKYRAPFSPMPAGFINVPYGDIAAVKDAMSDKTCAVLMECIQGEGGIIEGGRDYLQALRTLCDKNGALLIFDEVQTGMGRTGKLFAHQLYGVEPDVFTLAKALGNGIPISAILAKEFCSAFAPSEHGTTFGGNPLSCTAGLAVMSELTKPGFLEKVAVKGARLKGKLLELKKHRHAIVDVRGEGLMVGVELHADYAVKDIAAAARAKGFILGIAGNNTLRLVPPLVIAETELDSLVEVLDELLAD